MNEFYPILMQRAPTVCKCTPYWGLPTPTPRFKKVSKPNIVLNCKYSILIFTKKSNGIRRCIAGGQQKVLSSIFLKKTFQKHVSQRNTAVMNCYTAIHKVEVTLVACLKLWIWTGHSETSEPNSKRSFLLLIPRSALTVVHMTKV